jgi:hypothetical protein
MTKNITVRKFNTKGEEIFEDFFDKKVKNKSLAIPFKFLRSEELTENINNDEIKIDLDRKFLNAFEFGKYLYNSLKDIKNLRFETGIFHWLTLAYFDKLFPGPSGGSQKSKYILNKKSLGSWKKHLVRLRWELFERFGPKSIVYLTKEINNWSDEEESIASSPTLISSESIIDTYARLYLRSDKNKNPIVISKRTIPGNHREFTKELSIYQLNFDIHRMTPNEILELLGDDFKMWLKRKE